jgi:lipid-A-disaccharide synthase
MNAPPVDRPLRVGMVAGEASGDNLGAALIHALRAQHPDVEFFGVAGSRMAAAGCEVWESADVLAVMGLTEVLKHLRRLLRLRRTLVRRFAAARPDVVIGIDAPDFNLGLERRLKRQGIATVHYVSPSVWAWREGRVKGIRAAADRVLCLLPFEPEFYRDHQVEAVFVGHPMADEIGMDVDQERARRRLGIAEGPLLALLPGSRQGEVARLGPILAETAAWLGLRRPDLTFVVPAASPAVGRQFAACLDDARVVERVRIVDGQAREVMAAADAVLCASGTATLEATLLKRPTVVVYRLSRLTWFLVATLGWVRVRHVALPNLLAERPFVPEFLQDDARPERIGPAVLQALDSAGSPGDWYDACAEIHRRLRRDASAGAATAILKLISEHH